MPDGVDLAAAACVPIAFGTADDCLFEFGRLEAGETVLVQAGAGGVGLAAIQLAKRAGATVLATASSDDSRARLEAYGLDHGINYRDDDFAAAVRRSPTAAASTSWSTRSAPPCRPASGRSPTAAGSPTSATPAATRSPVDVSALMMGNQSIQGVFLGAELAIGDRAYDNVARLLGLVAAGELEVVVDSTYPLAEAAAAHAHVEDRQAFGRVVLVP